MRLFITGAAGFIGYHLAARAIADGHVVTGLDSFTPYYDVRLKRTRAAHLLQGAGAANRFALLEQDLCDTAALREAIDRAQPDAVIHLAAQPGVRYSIENPALYVEVNVTGTFNLLEACRAVGVGHLVLASTSSVYGANADIPFREDARTDHPVSHYAATKKAAEAISHAYAHLYRIPTTVLRFFTVYGPWGRPDMAPFKFIEAIAEGRPIDVYGYGAPERDFTYVDDLVDAILRLVPLVPDGAAPHGLGDSPVGPWRAVNIGPGEPRSVEALIAAIEAALGRKAVRRDLPMQPGDMLRTYAAVDELVRLTGFRPEITLEDGIARLVRWRDETWLPLRAGWT